VSKVCRRHRFSIPRGAEVPGSYRSALRLGSEV